VKAIHKRDDEFDEHLHRRDELAFEEELHRRDEIEVELYRREENSVSASVFYSPYSYLPANFSSSRVKMHLLRLYCAK
jgi:hypothetical protein